MSEIAIRLAVTPADYRACQIAQRAAWGITEDGYVLPVATMVGAQLHGGLVLGAFLPDGQAIGLSFAFLGRTEEGRTCFYSQLTGVVPEYQAHGIGGKLKQLQWRIARERGVDLVCWAFDPLQAGNAKFNLDKLGATSHRYLVDMYGPRTDTLNAGSPTDRLIVEWETQPDTYPNTIFEERRIEVPHAFNQLRLVNSAEADRWRLEVRHAFLDAFAKGFRAEGFEKIEGDEGPRCYYRLARRSNIDSPTSR